MLESPLVAVFVTEFLKYSQTFIFDEIRHHERYEVEVFCHRRVNEGLFAYPRVHSLTPASGALGEIEALLYKATAVSPRFLRHLRRLRPNLLHAHFGPGSIYALPIRQALNVPLVVTFHGYDVPALRGLSRFRPSNWRYALFARTLLRSVDRFLAASTELADMLVGLGAPPGRVRVWRTGVEVPPLAPRSGRPGGPVILMAGRFVEKKGFEYGLEAFASVAGRHPGARLRLIGDGPRRARYERLIRARGIADKVELAGVLPHHETLAEMARADVLLAPSVVAPNGDRESGVVVIKEANARGVPAIGTRHGGIPEIIDHEDTGLVVGERDVQALAEGLHTLIASPTLREAMGRRAREKMIRDYEITDCVRALERHYDEVIG